MTARLGRVLGIAIAICFVTGLMSELQDHPLSWLPWPAAPVSIYRVTQGVHVLTGTACLPLVMVKLWSVYPNLWRFPPVRSIRHALERASVALLVAATLVQLVTGYLNSLNWYPFRWYFVDTHHYLAYVVTGSVLLHVALKLPDIVYGLRADVAEADVLTEVPWDENPESHSIAGDLPAPVTPGVSRRGVLAATGVGIGAVVVTAAGQSLTPLEPIGLLAIRQWNRGPQDVPVNRTAEQAEVTGLAVAPDWVLQVDGATSFQLTLADLEPSATREARFPISCVEGWSVGAAWRGLSLLDLVRRAGGDERSSVQVFSFEPLGAYNQSVITGPQLGAALLATHLNGQVERMLLARRLFAAAGLALLAYGVARLFLVVALADLFLLLVWMAGAVVIHDGLLSPLVLGVGAALRRWVPDRGRRYVQLALITGAMITLVALPMIYLEGSQPPEKAILLQDYGRNLTLLLGIVAVATLALYAVRVARDTRGSRPAAPISPVDP